MTEGQRTKDLVEVCPPHPVGDRLGSDDGANRVPPPVEKGGQRGGQDQRLFKHAFPGRRRLIGVLPEFRGGGGEGDRDLPLVLSLGFPDHQSALSRRGFPVDGSRIVASLIPSKVVQGRDRKSTSELQSRENLV